MGERTGPINLKFDSHFGPKKLQKSGINTSVVITD